MRCNPTVHDSHGLSKRRSELPGNKVVCLFVFLCVFSFVERSKLSGKHYHLSWWKKAYTSQRPRRTELIPVSLADLGVLLLPWMVRWSIAGIPCSTMSPVTICACTWVKRVIKCSECPSLSKETTQRPRLEYWTSRSGVRVFNRSATQATTKQSKSILMLYRCLSS